MVITHEQRILAKHRFERAESTFIEAADELSRDNFRLAVNRSYYYAFYAMRAFLALVNKDSSKHSGVISLFNQHFIKPCIISDVSFRSIQSLMDLRHEGDYQDFAEITGEEAKGAVETAKALIDSLRDILKGFLDEQESEG